MNLEESNEIYQKNKQKNAKKQTILGGIVLCIIIIVICFVGIFYLKQKEKSRFKMFADGKEVNLNQNLIVKDESGIEYVNIKELANYTGYKYTQGDYIEVNENKNSCYLENDYEIVTFKSDEKTFTKYIKNKNSSLSENNNTTNTATTETDSEESKTSTGEIKYIVKSKDGEKEDFSIENPIKTINEQLYIPMDVVYLAYNSNIIVSENSLQIYSLNYLVQYGQSIAAKQGYKSVSSTYENLRTIANDMLVVGNENEFGVISLKDGQIILSVRYDDIKYVQNENKFYVYIDSKVGIMDAEGNTIISPKDYDSIETFDVNKKLFLVKKDSKYGIINTSGETVLHTDFDSIGIPDIDQFNLDNLENKNLWYDNIVAVKKGTVYELYEIDTGKKISENSYTGFGYKTKTTDTSGEENTLIIPKSTGVEGIVLTSGDLYGIYDINLKREVIPCLCSRIYSITNNGVTTYYMEFNGNQLEMRKYFEDHNMITAK
ncbi:MAG: WG repeat-containing protein [Candidatus Scatovivens sp.]